MATFSGLNTVTISTKRPPALSGGKRGVRVTYLTSVSALSPMPMSSTGQELVLMRKGAVGQSIKLFESYINYQTHTKSGGSVTETPDIKEEDTLIAGGVTYNVYFVGDWPESALTPFIHVALEKIKF